MSEVNNQAALDVLKRPDGKRDKAQPVQVVRQRKQEPRCNWFTSLLADELDKALAAYDGWKGDE